MEMPRPNPKIIAGKASIVAQLENVLPKDSIIHEESETRAYECDALAAYRCAPMIVVLPTTTQEVSDILKICHRACIPVIPRGTGTSLTGGALPTQDSLVLGVSRMTEILEIDYESRLIRVQAGLTNVGVTAAVQDDGFFYAPDPASQLACAIAGNVAMNSGGAHCLKYGVTTNNLLGVTLVQMDGTIVEIGGDSMEASGIDLLGVICGSEGQLGVVTEATLSILPKPEGAMPMLLGFDSTEGAGSCVAGIISAGIVPAAIEFMDQMLIEVCENFAQAGYPNCAAVLIVEVEGSPEEIEHQFELINAVAAQHAPVSVVTARDPEQAERVWAGRKAAYSALGAKADFIVLDGTVPVSTLPDVLRQIAVLSEAYGLPVGNVFHAGDGNMHPMICYDANTAGQQELCEQLGAEILKLCVDVGGCLTGEHGVGIEKRDLMLHQFSEYDLEIQMRVKDTFDPLWLLNPAKVFPLASSDARRAAGAHFA